MASDATAPQPGADFDKWLDWSGTIDDGNEQSKGPFLRIPGGSSSQRPTYPISPSSTFNGDPLSSVSKASIYTAPSSIGPLTPSHSSGSPEMFPATQFRLSGDTLRDDESSNRPFQLKRKLSSSEEGYGPEEPVVKARPTGSKRPHNVIEKRYRANLNEKIAELRDSVPSLRVLQKVRNKENGNGGSDEEDLDGLTPSGKLNKASILTKAVEYIRHLEFRNKRLEDENKSLKERLQTLDKVIARGGNDAARATAFTTENVIEETTTESGMTDHTKGDPTEQQGKIPMPEAWAKIRQTQQSSSHYGHVYQNPSDRSRLGGKWTSRIMLGSIAGLVIMDGFAESDQGTDSKEKGLFGIPLEILDGWTFLSSPKVYLATFAEYCQAGGVIPLIKGFLALTILAFLVFTYLFNSKPHSCADNEKSTHEEPQAARPASPIEVRRRAWSTSMQALRLPHHSFFPEWLAVTSEWLNYTARYLLGPQLYASLTGRTADDEIARIKNWDIAIDAQLAGGDCEVSRSRVVLTIFGSGTLPQTPMRLMQKALHCRLLLWNVGLPGTTASRLARSMAIYFANRQWCRARQLHERLSARDADRLPGYLNYLLQIDCDDVFNDLVTQRASNLMYDRTTSEYAEDLLMDVVVEDHAIRSPLDAIAAWRSTCALQEALDAALRSPDSPDLLREHIQAALSIAPPGSAAETRALAVHAVLSPGRRHNFYSKALEALTAVSAPEPPGHATEISIPFFIDSSTPASARPEIAACLHCANVMLTLDQGRNVQKAVALMSAANNVHVPSTILTAAVQFFVLYRLWRAHTADTDISVCTAVAVELHRFFTCEISRGQNTHATRLNAAVDFLQTNWKAPLVLTPMPSRRHSMISNDTGYGSLSEHEDEQQLVGICSLTQKSSTTSNDGKSVMTLGV